MSWSDTFKSGIMPDGTIQHFDSELEYEEAVQKYFDDLNVWLEYA